MDTTLPGPGSTRKEVLVVEDNPIHQVVVSSMLTQIGVSFDLVESGEAAVAAWESTTYGLILMDVHLPGMDGISATQEIRRREDLRGDSSRVPVVAMSANITPEEIELYRQNGMSGYIGKPLDPARLKKALETWAR